MDSKERERERKSLVCAATRWSMHMLSEVVDNHAEVMPLKALEELMAATAALHRAGELVRASMPNLEEGELEYVTLPAYTTLGSNTVLVIKAVRNATNLTLAAAKRLVEQGATLELPPARAQELRSDIARALGR